MYVSSSVEVSDPGFGAFLPPGSGIRIRDKTMEQWSDPDPGSGIRDKTSRIRNTGVTECKTVNTVIYRKTQPVF
jgi:hypothetical protein